MKDYFQEKTDPDKRFLDFGVKSKDCRLLIKEETCYIGRLIVHPRFKNRGAGTKLMSEIESIFKNAQRFELFTGHKSKRNIHLYQKLGYKMFKNERIIDGVELVYLEKRPVYP